jgi:hypothetical protein
MGKRKIVQLTTLSETEEHNAVLIAKCDDDSIWLYYLGVGVVSAWVMVPAIPEAV